MKPQKKSGLLLSALALGMLFSCSKNEEVGVPTEQTAIVESVIQQPSALDKECSFVDGNWSSTAVLSSTIGTAAETSFMRSQLSKIAGVWGVPSVALSFVKDPSRPSSTYNAISYGSGKIYYGEAIYKAAKSKGQVANAMILAHEFGHQLQYRFNLPSVDENTARAGELEADGSSGYYLRRPAGYNATSFAAIAPAYEFAFAIGDNSTSSPNHHGTPPQRRSAVRLGWLLGQYTLNARDFDYYFFYYYNGVLSGTYRQAGTKRISPEIDNYIKSHAEELRRIQTGQMSQEEYENLQ
jgi:uncharacterized protein